MKEIKLEIGNETFNVDVNFRTSFRLTKFRNKLSYGIDFTEADKSIIEEIIRFKDKYSEDSENIDMSELSPEAIKYLGDMSKSKADIFDFDEFVEMGKVLTNIEDEEKLLQLYDEEVAENGYDVLIAKLTETMAEVFINAKSPSGKNTKKTTAKKK